MEKVFVRAGILPKTTRCSFESFSEKNETPLPLQKPIHARKIFEMRKNESVETYETSSCRWMGLRARLYKGILPDTLSEYPAGDPV